MFVFKMFMLKEIAASRQIRRTRFNIRFSWLRHLNLCLDFHLSRALLVHEEFLAEQANSAFTPDASLSYTNGLVEMRLRGMPR